MDILQRQLNRVTLVSKPSNRTACPIVQAVSSLLDKTGSRPLVVAYSGGMDSTVLLHALARLKAPVSAVHIHHGLQAVADDWVIHCQQQAEGYGISLSVGYVQVGNASRRGLEDRAREVRYDALWQQVEPNGVLLTAHHQRDQAETFLLRALRGAGVAGLGAIQAWQDRDHGRSLVRPLLSVSYSDMQGYAQREGLTWIEDPTNGADFALRNRVRNQVLPLLHQLQPQCEAQLAMVASHAQEAAALLQLMAEEDWRRCQLTSLTWDVLAWRALPWIRAKNTLMAQWQTRAGLALSAAQWLQIKQQFYDVVQDDAHPRFCWQGQCLLVEGMVGYWLSEAVLRKPEPIMAWALQEGTDKKWGMIARLVGASIDQKGVLVDIKPRQGGEVMTTAQGSKRLKKWLQEQQVPAWKKAHWPVVYDAQSGQLLGWANMPANWWQATVMLEIAWLL
jgi:tRNA(Ile)-lysidine synthase